MKQDRGREEEGRRGVNEWDERLSRTRAVVADLNMVVSVSN